jgi:hypothetical protein
MATRMPNPSAVPLVDRSGRLTSEWVRWLQDLTGEVEDASTPTPAPPAPTPAPTPDPAPATAALISQLSLEVAGLQQLPEPTPDLAWLGALQALQQAPVSTPDRTTLAALQALQIDPTPAQHAARIAALERAINDIRQEP